MASDSEEVLLKLRAVQMQRNGFEYRLKGVATAILIASVATLVGCSGVKGAEKKDKLTADAPDKKVEAKPVGDKVSEPEGPVDLGGVEPQPLPEPDKASEADKAPPKRPDAGTEQVVVSAAANSAIEEAISMMEGDDLAGARRRLEGLLSDQQAAFLANFNLGIVADREGKTEDALAFFRESLRLNADFSPALVSLCRIHLRMGNPGLAIQTADKYIREKPQNLNHVDARLQVLNATRRYEDVIRDAKAILRRDERNVRAMVNLATAYHKLGKHELSEEVLVQVEEVTKEKAVLAEVRYRLGFVYLAMDKELKARKAFEKAVNLRPDYAEAFNNLGVLYHKARDYESAVSQFESAIRVFPGYREAYLNLGNAHKGLKDYEDAETAFKQVMRIDGKYPMAYFNLGILYLDAIFEGRDKKEQYQLAIDNFNRYKMEMKASLPRDDPTDKYIEEAKKKIDLEIRKEKMRREAAMEAEEGGDDEEFEEFPEDDGGDGGDGGDDGDIDEEEDEGDK